MGKQKLKDLVKQLNADNAPPDGWHPQDQVAAPKKRRKKKKSLIEQMNDYYGCEYIVDGSKLRKTNLKQVKYTLLLEVPVLAA